MNFFICIKKRSIITVLVCFVLILSHFFFYSHFNAYKKVVDSVSHSIFNSFTGEKNTTEEDGNIYFVSNFGEYINLGANLPKLTLPSEEEYILENGVFSFNLKENFTINCAGVGIVKKIGYLENGLKFLEVRHSGNIVTRYENLKIVGVGENFNVKNVHILGTCLGDCSFVFKVLKNDKVLENYKIENGELKWQN